MVENFSFLKSKQAFKFELKIVVIFEFYNINTLGHFRIYFLDFYCNINQFDLSVLKLYFLKRWFLIHTKHPLLYQSYVNFILFNNLVINLTDVIYWSKLKKSLLFIIVIYVLSYPSLLIVGYYHPRITLALIKLLNLFVVFGYFKVNSLSPIVWKPISKNVPVSKL